jgi:hypothetical protein
MPDTKISALTAGDPALSTDAIPISRAGANFKVTAGSIAALSPAGTVTSVGGTGTVNGITLTGTVTSTGSLTLGGALSGVSLTTQVSGTLPTANGGTNLTTFTSGGAVYATSTSALTTGTLPLASGGTGQTTKAAAFNALSPVTSTGDLILGNGTNSNTRLAIGTNAYVLTSNGSTASWQPAAGGGGGVTSLSGGSTGLNPSIPTTGAVTLSGTLFISAGGTGTTTSPSNGQLLIGNGGGYSVANLTAGTGITITNAFGAITIAASGGGGGATIRNLTITTSGFGTFVNSTPSSSISKPLIGYTAGSPTNYGAFFFKTSTSSNYVLGPVFITSIGITDSAGTPTSYTSGPDFGGSPSTFTVYDDTATCYGLSIFSAGMQTLFTTSKAAITSPSLAPIDASSAFGFTNPNITVSTSGLTYDNATGQRGIVVSKSGTDYLLQFGSADTISAAPSVTSISFNINGSPSSYSNFSDFNVSFAFNSASGMFIMQMSVSNMTLQTLLNNSFL